MDGWTEGEGSLQMGLKGQTDEGTGLRGWREEATGSEMAGQGDGWTDGWMHRWMDRWRGLPVDGG